MIGEALPVTLVERRRAAENIASRPQLLHEIAQGQALTNIVFRVELSSRVERVSPACDHLGGQRNVSGDHEVPGLDLLHDLMVGDVEALSDADALDERGRGDPKQRVRDERRQDLRALGGPEQDLLDDLRARVRVDPDLQRQLPLSAESKRSSYVKALRLRGLRPQRLGSFHSHGALWARPPLIIDVVARPHTTSVVIFVGSPAETRFGGSRSPVLYFARHRFDPGGSWPRRFDQSWPSDGSALRS